MSLSLSLYIYIYLHIYIYIYIYIEPMPPAVLTDNIKNCWTEPSFRANILFGEPPSRGLL